MLIDVVLCHSANFDD